MNQQPMGLVCAGSVKQSWIAKVTPLWDRLGPVKSTSIRVASRIVNAMHAGYASAGYDALNGCSVLFVAVLPSQISQVLEELTHAHLNWRGKTLVLLDSSVDDEDLSAFRLRQAHTATIDIVEESAELRLVAQGDSRTVKMLRRLFETGRIRLLEISPGTKAVFFAGITIAGSFTAPLMAASVECLTATGVKLSQAQLVADAVVSRGRRAYLKAGKKGWIGALAAGDLESLRRQWESVSRLNPDLARYFLDTAAASASYMGTELPNISTLKAHPSRHREAHRAGAADY